MNYFITAQYMAAAAFFTAALIHGLIWLRARSEVVHLLFALTAVAAGTNAMAEAAMYRSGDLETMASSLRWYVTTSGLFAITAVCFLGAYAGIGRLGKTVAALIIAVCTLAMIQNLLSPSSYIYTDLTSLREVVLPWGDHIWLAIGEDNPMRIVTDLALFAILLVLADGCYQLDRSGERRRAIVFGVSVGIFIALFSTHAFLVDTRRLDSPYLSTFGFLALVALTSYDLAGDVMRKSLLSSELQQLESDMETAVTDERNRLAGELHDSVTQTLFSTAAIADALPEVWRRNPDEGKRGLEDLRQLTRGALAEMRTLLLELHPTTLLNEQLGDLLQQLADATTGRTRIPVVVTIDGSMEFPDHVHIALYRIAQESLNNVLKHAAASEVQLDLRCDEPEAVLEIRDNGRGFDPAIADSGMGLKLMQERAESIGARWDLCSEPDACTSIIVRWKRDASAKA